MIQLKYQPKPTELTAQVEQTLTDEFKATGKSVWSKDYIKEALLKMSHEKCCYCEAPLQQSGNDMEVEHFLPKSVFPDKVVEWKNLLPACGHCNGTKNAHNPAIEPIIHPVHDNPQEHLSLKNYYLRGNSEKGRMLVTVLKMNHVKQSKPRFTIGIKLTGRLEILKEKAEESLLNPNSSKHIKTRIKNELEELMFECCPGAEYSAVCATILLNDENYQTIRQMFVNENLWTDDYQALEDKLKKCALPEK